jgi:hypothetical protein
MTDIGNANDKATILADAKTFFSSYFADSDANEIIQWNTYFDNVGGGLFWYMGAFPAALIQVYDLVLPVDLDQAGTYLSRLGAIAFALLENRDDNRNNPMDPFRGRVMPAWGGVAHDRDDQWNTDVVTSGLFVYAMAAFARRVVDRPRLYPTSMPRRSLTSRRRSRPTRHFVKGNSISSTAIPLLGLLFR